jgi:hypothetical protein
LDKSNCPTSITSLFSGVFFSKIFYDCFVNYRDKTVYIIEKKFQSSAGSVDEKLQTCDFKRKQYKKLFSSIGYDIQYIYLLCDWFRKPEYRDVLQYIKDVGCDYYFNEIPLDKLNIGAMPNDKYKLIIKEGQFK